MNKKFGKAILMCPEQYSLFGVFREILSFLVTDTVSVNIRNFAGAYDLKIHSQIFRFPYSLREKWERHFLKKLNDKFLIIFRQINPELIFIYNSEFLLPETCREIKKSCKIIFFLGDSPFFTPGNANNLAILQLADLILSPDTFWMSQLKITGLKQTRFFVPGININDYFPIKDKGGDQDFSSELLYAGMSYPNSWGYKKALLMSMFTQFDLKIYGSRHWKKWFGYFPELESRFYESAYIPVEKLNIMMNYTKLMPVDGNPGILNGFHIRLMEALGSGALPLIEFRSDLKTEVFRGIGYELPLIDDYSKAKDMAAYYLQNDNERIGLANFMREYILKNYSHNKNADNISEWLNL